MLTVTGVRDGKRNNGKRQKLISASWFSFSQYTWPLSRCIQNLEILALTGAEKFDWKERTIIKWTNKGLISRRRPILLYATQQVIPNICTKFENQERSEKSLAKQKVYTHIQTEKMKTIYPLYTSYTRGIIKIETPPYKTQA